jgi:hypothetical protein
VKRAERLVAVADDPKAKAYFALLAEPWRDADADLPALSEVRTSRQ